MNKKNHHYFSIFISKPAILTLTSSLLLSLDTYALTCKNLFLSQRNSQAKKISKESSVSTKNTDQTKNSNKLALAQNSDQQPKTTSLISRNEEFKIFDYTNIDRGGQQFPGSIYLDQSQVRSFYFRQDAFGDQFDIEIFPHGTPLHLANQNRNDQAFTQKQAAAQQLGYNGRQSHAQQHSSQQLALNNRVGNQQQLQTTTSSVATYSKTNLSSSDKESLIRDYIYATNERLSPETINHLVQTLKGDKEILDLALAFHNQKNKIIAQTNQSIEQSNRSHTNDYNRPQTQIDGIKLTNYDNNKFFWFIPSGKTEHHPARVLDVHNDPDNGVIILIEYIVDNDSVDSARSRNIIEIRPSELSTIQVSGKFSREASQTSFLNSLSKVELETKRLAHTHKLRLFGFTDFRRTPGHYERSSSYGTPLEWMTNISWLAMYKSISDRWPNFKDYYTSAEKDKHPNEVNIIDIFSRMRADFVVRNFRTNDFEYTWVITEDGQLKITPKMRVNNNLKPQILRLAAGRRVFAGGDFIFRPDGSLVITLESHQYQDNNQSWGARRSFEESSQLNNFINAVFATQAHVGVHSINSIPVTNYYSENANSGNSSFQWGQAGRNSHFTHERNSSENDFNNFMRNTFTEAGLNKNKSEIDLQWNIEAETPLDFASWVKASNIKETNYNQEQLKIRWAHYVLKTDPNTALDKIKKSYRKLSMNFHPDRSNHENAIIAQQLFNIAWNILKNVGN